MILSLVTADQALAVARDAAALIAPGTLFCDMNSVAPQTKQAAPNLFFDLSGMHFQRKPALASETGPLDPAWKAVIEKHPDRFLMGIDVWAARLFEPATLDMLMTWTRRILGELKADVAERVAWKNAAALLKLE
jgi:predicted TIM-barrel fold metal-dependent hydrolase